MIEFTNIIIENNYIYADEKDLMTGETSSVKIHVRNEEYYANPPLVSMDMRKAIWCLQSRYERYKSLESKERIAWG